MPHRVKALAKRRLVEIISAYNIECLVLLLGGSI